MIYPSAFNLSSSTTLESHQFLLYTYMTRDFFKRVKNSQKPIVICKVVLGVKGIIFAFYVVCVLMCARQ